jgi:hypothetical protein
LVPEPLVLVLPPLADALVPVFAFDVAEPVPFVDAPPPSLPAQAAANPRAPSAITGTQRRRRRRVRKSFDRCKVSVGTKRIMGTSNKRMVS